MGKNCLERVLTVLILSAVCAHSQTADPRLGSADWERRAEAARDLSLISLLTSQDAVVGAAFNTRNIPASGPHW